MSAFFFDSSALAKRYAPEVGSGWVISLTDAASDHDILLAEITLVEVAALYRRPNCLSLRRGSQLGRCSVVRCEWSGEVESETSPPQGHWYLHILAPALRDGIEEPGA